MAQNLFAGGYTINEDEPSSLNKLDNNENKDPLKNIQPGGGIYGEFAQNDSFDVRNEEADEYEEFCATEKGKNLKEALGDENKAVFDAIVNAYIQTEYPDMKWAINYIVEAKGEELGLIFENEKDKKKLIDTLLSAYIGIDVEADKIVSNTDFGYGWDMETIEQSSYVPVLNRFVDGHDLRKDEITNISEGLLMGAPVEEVLENDIQDGEKRTQLKTLVENIDNIEENRNNFEADFASVGEKFDPQGDTVIQMVAQSYVRIPDANGEYNKNLDLSTAIQISAGKLLEQSHIDKTTESYKKAMKDIFHSKSDVQIQGLRDLFKITTAEKGKGKLKKDQNKRFADKEEKMLADVKRRSQDIKTLLAKAKQDGNKKKVAEQKSQAEVLRAELKENKVAGGEVQNLGGGKDDVLAQIDVALKEDTI